MPTIKKTSPTKKSITSNRTQKNANKSKRKLQVFAPLFLALVAISALMFIHHAGPLNSILRPLSSTAPLMQQDGTQLHTADGLASSTTILVKFRSDISQASANSIHQQNGTKLRRTIAGIGVQEISVPDAGQVGATLKKYRSYGQVEYAEPNPVAQRFMTPNDTLYAKQWSLARVNAPAAWDSSQGGYGPIAVVDTGIDAAHSDLAGEIVPGYNYVSDTTNTNDDNGHGTHVAGIIAGITNNGSGVASIGFKGTLIPVKVLDSTGAGTYASVASGIIFAADHGARVINLSLGGSSTSNTLESAVLYAQQKGAIVVAAAGNNGNDAAVYPADYKGVVAVSASTADDTLASFSSYGNSVYVSAPGVDIISTYNNGGYASMSGTSMAAPEVAGLLGLALSHKQVDGGTLLGYLQQSSDKIGSYPYDASGRNQYFGYGRINAARLMQLLDGTTTPTAPQTATPDLKTSPVSSDSKTIHGQASAQFSIDFEGSIDSIDEAQGIVTVKIKSVSQNFKLADNNLIKLYITGSTSITAQGQTLPLGSLSAGDTIGGKALWQDNQLSATSLDLHGQPTNSQAAVHGRRGAE